MARLAQYPGSPFRTSTQWEDPPAVAGGGTGTTRRVATQTDAPSARRAQIPFAAMDMGAKRFKRDPYSRPIGPTSNGVNRPTWRVGRWDRGPRGFGVRWRGTNEAHVERSPRASPGIDRSL